MWRGGSLRETGRRGSGSHSLVGNSGTRIPNTGMDSLLSPVAESRPHPLVFDVKGQERRGGDPGLGSCGPGRRPLLGYAPRLDPPPTSQFGSVTLVDDYSPEPNVTLSPSSSARFDNSVAPHFDSDRSVRGSPGGGLSQESGGEERGSRGGREGGTGYVT